MYTTYTFLRLFTFLCNANEIKMDTLHEVSGSSRFNDRLDPSHFHTTSSVIHSFSFGFDHRLCD